MVTIDKLVKEYHYGTKHRKIGNHFMKQDDKEVKFYYHAIAICVIDKSTKEVKYDDGNWGTVSTKRAINCYKRIFSKSLNVF